MSLSVGRVAKPCPPGPEAPANIPLAVRCPSMVDLSRLSGEVVVHWHLLPLPLLLGLNGVSAGTVASNDDQGCRHLGIPPDCLIGTDARLHVLIRLISARKRSL